MEPDQREKILDEVNKNRRGFLKTLLGASFTAPLIASFSVGTLLTNTANASPPGTPVFDNQLLLELWFRSSDSGITP
jgi:hypothetical protein